jgi:MFS family permease
LQSEVPNPALRLRYLFLNVGHFVDHLMMLIFAKAAFDAGRAFGLGADHAYAEMLPYAMPGVVLFAACSPLAALLAGRFGRNPMIVVFFVGIGLTAIVAGFARSPLEISIALGALGAFAAIYHPVGLAMVVQGGGNVGWRIGVNGVWGNMGVAAAPLLAGFFLSSYSWQLAFIVPGFIAVLIGIAYAIFVRRGHGSPAPAKVGKGAVGFAPGWQRALLALALVTMAGGFVFGAMTFLIPRLFDVKMSGITSSAALTGALAAAVYAVAAFAQLGVGKLIDHRPAKPILLCVAAGQPVMIALMAMQSDLALFFASVVGMAFVFGQIPISDTVMARYVPDHWRAHVMAIKVLLNLGIGATVLPIASYILQTGGGFETVFTILAMASCFVLLAALLLPGKSPTVALEQQA